MTMLALLLSITTAIAPRDAPPVNACAAAAALEREAPELCPLLAGISPADSPEVLEFAGHFGRAGTLIETGELDLAEEELVLAARVSATLSGVFDFAVEERVGDLRRNQWRLDEAVFHYASVFDAAANRNVRRADLARKLAEAESLRGHPEEALAWNGKASEIVGGTGDASLALRVDLQHATLLFDAGREREADALRTEALAQARKSNHPDDILLVLIEVGNAHLLRGQYGEALTYFDEVLELVQRSGRPEMEAYAWSVVTMLYVLIEDDNSARAAIERGAALAERSTSPLPRAMIGAVAIARRFGMDDTGGAEFLAVFSSLMSMPVARSTAGPPDVTALDNAVGLTMDFIAPLPLRGISKPLRALHALRLLERGFTAEAREILFEVLGETSNLDFRSFYLTMIGGSYILEHNLEEAIRYYAESIDVLELVARELRGEEMLSGFFGSSRRIAYEILIKLLTLHGCPDVALSYAERARSRAFLQMIGNRRINPHHERGTQEMESLRARIGQWELQARLGSPAAHSDLDQARRRYRELLVRAKASDPEYAQLIAIPSLDLDGIREELPPATTLVEYYVAEYRIHVWVIDREHFDSVTVPITGNDLERVTCWTAQLRSAGRVARGMRREDADCALETKSEELYELLIAPVRRFIRHPRVMFVPHGVLHYVPFAALRDPSTRHFLVEDFTITYVPSISVLRILRGKETPMNGRALIIGDPATPFASQRLSGAQTEAVRIAKRFGARAKIGSAAKESLLYDLRGRFDLVHIGAHGEYDASNPLFSRIVLAPDRTHDGFLEVLEILGSVDMTGVNLVVLSACGTGRGTPTGGDEVVSLVRAIHRAGSPGVIATLWDIDDAATATLMGEFYARLRNRAPAADALRDAQRAMLRRSPYRDPVYWAAFVLSGDPRGRWRTSH